MVRDGRRLRGSQGEMGHRSARVKAAREERGKLKEAEMEVDREMEVDAGVSQAESAERYSPKRKVIRVESEETQDYVCEILIISPEKAEELAFVPNALSEPRGAIYFCDNHWGEKAVRYWQFASVVVEEGGEAHTINLCQQCYNEQMVQQGKPRLTSRQWRAVVEKKAQRGRSWKVMGNNLSEECGSEWQT